MNSPNFRTVDEYVAERDGDRSIKKVLIANNGIGAVKAIRSIRRWAYEMFDNERAVQFVVMATPEDMRANAEYIRMADEVVDVPGGANNNNYANVLLIVEIAERWQVDAVWAGWGHASENPLLPDSLAKTERKIVFIGPTGGPMRALGDKIGSTIIAQSAEVPCIAWNGDGLTCDYAKDGKVPEDIYRQADVSSAEQAVEVCERIGFPVMIKASEGGGGKGIRKVLESSQVVSAFRQVQGEIPGSPIFVMKLAPRSRHLEVQLLADKHGQAIALNGRDCSVQRRHQKIIEEGPPLAAEPAQWKEMERAAVSLAKAVDYQNAGTVEYLFTVEDGKFYFLELNPRLQVEHPVTEMITKVNLPASQLQVAMGIPLHLIPDVRKLYGRDPLGKDTIDFENEERTPPNGHCIAVRITAENPDQGFRPTSGNIQELNFRSTPEVWGYFSVNSSGLVHEFADSQFGHLFASGLTRDAARKNMVLALKELSIRGNIRTTVEYIVKMMHSEDFIENRIDTSWLDQRIADHGALAKVESNVDAMLVVIVGATIKAYQNAMAKAQDFTDLMDKGQVPPLELVSVNDKIDLIFNNVKYSLQCSQAGPKAFTIACNGSYVQTECRALSDGGYLVSLGGKSKPAYMTSDGNNLRLLLDGSTCIFTKEYDPTCLAAEVAGKLVKCLVPDGSHVAQGEPFAEIEVMKMFMPLTAPESGVISWVLTEGAALSPGDVMANLELDDPSSVTKAEVFSGTLPNIDVAGGEESMQNMPHWRLRNSVEKLDMLMLGYDIPQDQYQKSIDDFSSAVVDPRLPLLEFEEGLSVLNGRIDGDLYDRLKSLADQYRRNMVEEHHVTKKSTFPVQEILPIISKHIRSLPESDRATSLSLVESIRNIANQYANGVAGRTVAALLSLVRQYLSVERIFAGTTFEAALKVLRRDFASEPEKIYEMCRSHAAISSKNALLLTLMEDISLAAKASREHKEMMAQATESPSSPTRKQPLKRQLSMLMSKEGADVEAFVPVLTEISMLHDQKYLRIALEARKLLIEQSNPSIENRNSLFKRAVKLAIEAGPIGDEHRFSQIQAFIAKNIPIRDFLINILKEGSPTDVAAIEIYIRKIYLTHIIHSFEGGSLETDPELTWAQWSFNTCPPEALPTGMARPESSFHLSQLRRIPSQGSIQSDGGVDSDGASSDSENQVTRIPPNVTRYGGFFKCRDFDDISQNFINLLTKFPRESSSIGAVNALHVVMTEKDEECTDAEAISERFSMFLKKHLDELAAANIRRVTFFVSSGSDPIQLPGIYTYRAKNDFSEDVLFRHIEPSLAFHLDLIRLSNFIMRLKDTTQTQNGNVHLYEAFPKKHVAAAEGLKGPHKKRYFARVVSLTSEYIPSEAERMFVESLNALTLAIDQDEQEQQVSGKHVFIPQNNHIFLNIVSPDTVLEPGDIATLMRKLMNRYQTKITRLGVAAFEVKLVCRFSAGSSPVPLRLVASNPTGYVLRIEAYVEVIEKNRAVFRSVGSTGTGDWEGLETTFPYNIAKPFQQQRNLASIMSDTLYCYDFLELFEEATQQNWAEFARERPQLKISCPQNVLVATELVVTWKGVDPEEKRPWTAKDLPNLELVEVARPAGQNDVGMVAWLATICTPEYPSGRKVVLIANDITFKAGSFGTREDVVFYLASKLAREEGLPRLYLAANSGARIGMSETVKSKFKVAWVNPEDPSQGYRYLYLSKEDYNTLSESEAVKCKLMVEQDEDRYMITDIVGTEPDLGVENLSGSGLIAGETSIAYKDIFTLTLCVGRSVGIGAYLIRLGQRTIQKQTESPIILTGYQALNKLMGREIYSSNDQLGGANAIMGPNGLTHIVAENHMDTVVSALKWLSYVPNVKNGYLPMVDITGTDMVEREVGFFPPKGTPYDPRHLLTGTVDDLDGVINSGFFDRGSFTESMAGWAKTVVCGRARLGGIPMGVIVTENRTVERLVPADPADPTSHERIIAQAGGVWFPDSAYKTATAIKDFNGEGLPLMIFANWRGFSGGQRDMFDEVLKFGSLIVDALVEYNQPIFVYLPPYSELRGGAWVVVDSAINSNVMEMYAAQDSRGGVLEANGAATIKFREKDQIAAAHRLDPVLQSLDARLAKDASPDTEPHLRLTEEQRADIASQIATRENRLKTIYSQIAVQFADLHDTPGRMTATGVVQAEVEWEHSRSFFYWRLRRKLAEFDVRKKIKDIKPENALAVCSDILKSWFLEQGYTEEAWDDDKEILDWMAKSDPLISQKLRGLKVERAAIDIQKLFVDDTEATVAALAHVMSQLNPEVKQKIMGSLS